MRRPLTAEVAGDAIAATLDDAPGTTALLIVSGGTEPRFGPQAAWSRLALRVAAAGHPVLRYDRRGVGDSDGNDPGFADSGPDLAAAAALLRAACPHVARIVAIGFCDGATVLALHHRAAAIDRLLLANPWVVPPTDGLPPPAAIRRRYLDRLTSREGWLRLARGQIDLRKAWRGLRAVAATAPAPLAIRVRLALAGAQAQALVTEDDATAIAFLAEHRRTPFPLGAIARRASASHGFLGDGDADWLAAQVIDTLVPSD